MHANPLQTRLEALYRQFNHRRYLHPDPLETVYWFTEPADQEIAGLLAASLAFGNVSQILRSLERLFQIMPSPRAFAVEESPRHMGLALKDFRHRYVDGTDVAALLLGVKRALHHYGTLGQCYGQICRKHEATPLAALNQFVAELSKADKRSKNYLLPQPNRGSACKRLHLYLRWMVRNDAIDLGLWRDVPPAVLLVPLDTHMHRIARALGFTQRQAGDGKTAEEVTHAFRRIAPVDPVRYDFALTRLGIRRDEKAKAIAARFLGNESVPESSRR